MNIKYESQQPSGQIDWLTVVVFRKSVEAEHQVLVEPVHHAEGYRHNEEEERNHR